MADLLPCPFCDKETLLTVEEAEENFSATDSDTTYYVRCDECGSEGPTHYVRETARELWNRRTSQPSPKGAVSVTDALERLVMLVEESWPSLSASEPIRDAKAALATVRVDATGLGDWGERLGLKTTVAMRARLRELSTAGSTDSYDHAVRLLLDDFARCMVLIAALLPAPQDASPAQDVEWGKEVERVLSRGMPFGYDPATGFFHEDDGGAPSSVVFYEPADGLHAEDSAAFKNFHRSLCERFNYTHDEKDWRRDQVSLIEWIAMHALSAQDAPSASLAGWQSMDSAPTRDMEAFLGWSERSGPVILHVGYNGDERRFYDSDALLDGGNYIRAYPTHWMPLPASPEQGEAL